MMWSHLLRWRITGAEGLRHEDLRHPVVEGDALSWRSLDVDVYVLGLVERAFGTRLFAAATGQRGGRWRSKAKAAAAKLNGAKGGRPRKRLPA